MNEKKTCILIVDDDKEFVEEAANVLHVLGDVSIDRGYSEEDFYSLYEPGKYNAIILDLRLKTDYEGMELLEYALNEDPEAPIVVLTGYASVETAIRSLKLGAKDYLQKEYFEEKPFRAMIEKIIIEDKARKLAQQMVAVAEPDHLIVGRDLKIQRIVKLANLFAQMKESPLLLVGEEGTEKEQIATYIYLKSGARGRFVKKLIDPGQEDVEADLFGDDKHPGLIIAARGGVLYLEEVFLLNAEIQQRLLEYINTGLLHKKGKKKAQGPRIKTQLIVSTSQSPDQIQKGKNYYSPFYYRVKTPEILVPPLRERGDDILLLARYYLEELKGAGKCGVEAIDDEVVEAFKTYPWPGNLWELNHIIEFSALNARLDESKVIKTVHLPADLQQGTVSPAETDQLNLDRILAETTLKYMRLALKKSKGAKLGAYQFLGYPESKRGTLNARMRKYFARYPDMIDKFGEIYRLYEEKEGDTPWKSH